MGELIQSTHVLYTNQEELSLNHAKQTATVLGAMTVENGKEKQTV